MSEFEKTLIGQLNLGIQAYPIQRRHKAANQTHRYSHLEAFFDFIRNDVDQDFRNPCDTPMMRRLFRDRGLVRWHTIEKETVDEVIFKTVKCRNRLMLELMARGGRKEERPDPACRWRSLAK